MADKKDDPREVLTLLNSLGFVGITAQQLKAFMKDLKMHRKIKERERQEWKDETKKKILLKQRELYREVLQEHKIETMSFNNGTESTISSESSTFHDDSSAYKVVTVKIRCVPKETDKENEAEETTNNNNNNDYKTKKNNFKKTHTSWAEEFRQNSFRYDDNGYNTSSSSSIHELHRRSSRIHSNNNKNENYSAGASTDSTKYISLEKPRNREFSRSEHGLKQTNLARPKSSPTRFRSNSNPRRNDDAGSENLKSTGDQPIDIHTNPPPSRTSIQSKGKSFIRPWRLQPESHRSSKNMKSDPVALYQKYKEEWKQLALPGEEHHAGIRWAVREKMLGNDPNPRLDIEMIDQMNRDYRSILDFKEHKVYRRKSRKIRKQFFSINNSNNHFPKPVYAATRKRYETTATCFKSVSESVLLRSRNLKFPGIVESQNPRSILAPGATVSETSDLTDIKIERSFKTESILCRESRNDGKIQSEFTSAKKTLGRLVENLLKKDINSYIADIEKVVQYFSNEKEMIKA